MNIDARNADIALELANDLAGEFGDEFVSETEKRLNSAQQGTRSFTFGISEAAAAAGLLLSCIQIAWQYASDKRMNELLERLEKDAPKPEKVSEEKRRSIIQRVAEKFTGPSKP